jgi:excisionase family DNA binding protein
VIAVNHGPSPDSNGYRRDAIMMSVAKASPALLTQEQVAQRLKVKPSTLQFWRVTGRYNLPFVKCGRLVRYREEDVRAFIDRRTREHTSSATVL